MILYTEPEYRNLSIPAIAFLLNRIQGNNMEDNYV